MAKNKKNNINNNVTPKNVTAGPTVKGTVILIMLFIVTGVSIALGPKIYDYIKNSGEKPPVVDVIEKTEEEKKQDIAKEALGTSIISGAKVEVNNCYLNDSCQTVIDDKLKDAVKLVLEVRIEQDGKVDHKVVSVALEKKEETKGLSISGFIDVVHDGMNGFNTVDYNMMDNEMSPQVRELCKNGNFVDDDGWTKYQNICTNIGNYLSEKSNENAYSNYSDDDKYVITDFYYEDINAYGDGYWCIVSDVYSKDGELKDTVKVKNSCEYDYKESAKDEIINLDPNNSQGITYKSLELVGTLSMEAKSQEVIKSK